MVALSQQEFVAMLRRNANFGRVFVAHDRIFVAGTLSWSTALNDYRPDRCDLLDTGIYLVGVAVIMYILRDRQ
ncbi:hypothetical protein ACFVH6_17270 [Spirillospora sp. NPDC127200]